MVEKHLAQLNLAQMRYPIDAAEMAEFVARLEDINALADESSGFIWRLQTDSGDATAINYFGPDTLVNMSLWQDLESLHHYVYRSAHTEVMARRREWFDRIDKAYSVLWWLPAGEIPTLGDAARRLEILCRDGPSARAFTFKNPFVAE